MTHPAHICFYSSNQTLNNQFSAKHSLYTALIHDFLFMGPSELHTDHIWPNLPPIPCRFSDQMIIIILTITTRDTVSKLEIPTLYFLLFVTTEMLKHLNTEKKSWMTSSLASQFSFFFFICLAITTDDIARHWESSSTAWETAMTNQVMRHGVIHLRVTPAVLPLWCTRTDARTHAHRHAPTQTLACTRTNSPTENWRSIVSWEGGQKKEIKVDKSTRLTRAMRFLLEMQVQDELPL